MIKNKSVSIFSVYFLSIFLAFHIAIPAYVNSSFLETFLATRHVGIIYTLGSTLTILGFWLLPYLLKRMGNYRLTMILLGLEVLVFLGLSFLRDSLWLTLCFLLATAISSFLYFSLDIFLEDFSRNKETGVIRGTYLTISNLIWIFAPLIASFILIGQNYHLIYFTSLLFILPTLLFILNFRHFKDPEYRAIQIRTTIKNVWQNKNLSTIFAANFLLRFFYSWMLIYTPIYLHQIIGLEWQSIGIVFSVMLIPFVLTQYPLGRLADKKYGEKEMLIIGFLVMAISTASISFITSSSVVVWAIILFITRIGASTVEIMSETYFFKKVGDVDANLIGFFRTAGPLAYIIGPVIATSLLVVAKIEMKSLFFILGLILLLGIFVSLRLKDTK